MKIKILILLSILLFSTYSWGKCFSSYTSELFYPKVKHQAIVILKKTLNNKSCMIKLKFSNTEVLGEANGKLCKAKNGSLVQVKVHGYCCDTPPCNKTKKNKLWFTN